MRLKSILQLTSGTLTILSGLYFVYAVAASRIEGLPRAPRIVAILAAFAFIVGLILAGISSIIAGLAKPPGLQMSKTATPNLDRLDLLINRLLEPELYIQIVERLPDALVVINSSTEIIIFNEQSSFLFGYHPSETIGQRLSILIPENRRELHDKHIARWFGEMRTRPMDIGLTLEGVDKSGRVFPVEIDLSPLIAPSGTYGMAVIRRSVLALAPREAEPDAGRT